MFKKHLLLLSLLILPVNGLAAGGFKTDIGGELYLEYNSLPECSESICTLSSHAGKICVDTGATTGNQIFACEGVTGWVVQGGGGALVGGAAIDNNSGTLDLDLTEAICTAPISCGATSITTSMSTARLLGRTTASTGIVEEITVASPLTLNGLALDITNIADVDLANNYSGVGACPANEYSHTLNDNAVPTCTQPDIDNLAGLTGIANAHTHSANVTMAIQTATCYQDSTGGDQYCFQSEATAPAGTQTFQFNIDPATCSGDGNGGCLTIEGTAIVCSPDDGGGGGGNSFTTIGSAVADSSTDTLTVTDSASVDFTTTNDPEDITAVVLPGGITLAGDVDGTANANDIDEANVSVELEGAMDLLDMRDGAAAGACTGSQPVRRNAGDTAWECFTTPADDDVPEAGDFGALTATLPITQSGGVISTSIATSRLVGRTTGGTGVMEEITVNSPLTLSGLALDITGIADVDLTSNYSGVGACSANTWASTLNDNAAPTCTQPSFANLAAGTASDVQISGNNEADEITLGGDLGGTAASATIANTDLARLIANCDLENDATPIPDSCVGDGTDDGGGGGGLSYVQVAASVLSGF